MRLGEHTISTYIDCDNIDDPSSCSTDNPPLQDIEIEKSIVHEQYDSFQKLNDIALLRLKHEPILKKIRSIATICLPVVPYQMIEKIAENDKNINLTTCGWGRTENSLVISDVLLQASIPLVPIGKCKKEFADYQSRLNTLVKLEITNSHLVN